MTKIRTFGNDKLKDTGIVIIGGQIFLSFLSSIKFLASKSGLLVARVRRPFCSTRLQSSIFSGFNFELDSSRHRISSGIVEAQGHEKCYRNLGPVNNDNDNISIDNRILYYH
jgi:hypothetical protein